ncbi:MAG TPA: L,D-transpeptidase family protein [Vicinamibacterales bacterium]|nr:L,D-transpeptidase family protein [Vicinamibacterales bacterium]
MTARLVTVGMGVPVVALSLLGLACSGEAAAPVREADAVTAAAPAQAAAAPVPLQEADIAATVERVLTSSEHPGLKWSAVPDVAPALRTLYDNEPDHLLWFDGATPSPTLEDTLDTVAAAGDRGLDPADYDAPQLAEQWATIQKFGAAGPELAHFDLAVSVAAARMLKAVHVGRVDPASMHWGYDIAAKAIDVPAAVRDVRQGKGLAAALDALEPPFPHYARARRTLTAYRALLPLGEPDAVPDLPKGRTKVGPGADWTGIPQLTARLRLLGDLPAAASPPTGYRGALVDAVRTFQERHGLDVDGIIGAGTIKALNVPVAQRIRQIELAMERMRWLPDLSERPNVFVNVPLFRMWATDPVTGEEPLRMNVVVGQSMNHKTPIFVEEMEYVIFRPYWNPPYGITVKELVPKARRDAGYMDREALEIVASGDDNAVALPPTPENLSRVVAGRLHMRQKPGPKNSLGLAKFIFPNAENVYMHGTPAQQLFSRTRRDFSHGCVRLEDPARFSEWVLRDQPAWTRARIDTAMQGDRPTRVSLTQKLTVVLFYDTVHVNSEGVVFFVDDIYGHDRALDAALGRGYPYPAAG